MMFTLQKKSPAVRQLELAGLHRHVIDEEGNSFSTLNIIVYANRDTIPPAVEIINPTDGQAGVTGLITVQINATDTSESIGNLIVRFWITDDQGVKDPRPYTTISIVFFSFLPKTVTVPG
jgi:hypothetical protein